MTICLGLVTWRLAKGCWVRVDFEVQVIRLEFRMSVRVALILTGLLCRVSIGDLVCLEGLDLVGVYVLPACGMVVVRAAGPRGELVVVALESVLSVTLNAGCDAFIVVGGVYPCRKVLLLGGSLDGGSRSNTGLSCRLERL